ncbi:glycosyltransferase [Lactobacillus crispatus]|uniref:glycosyltransferase n=1 Tax=Lactobacillus crispatus TaxID=47770 RepID=UPI0022E717B4|nr:glycosyltransferase [Lactobacillus crispatus]
MKRVLVYGMTENYGGVESVIINYYRHIPTDHVQFDFITNSQKPIAYQDEILGNGGKVFVIPVKEKHPIEYRKVVHNFFKEKGNQYDAIWVNRNDLINIDYLKLARKYGIKKRIIHSHNTKLLVNDRTAFIKYLAHLHNKRQIAKYATDFWACTSEAGNWLFPSNVNSKIQIINNAVDLNKLKFDEKKRQKIRKMFNLQNDFVIGNVGRLTFQKNQLFLIDILKDIVKEIPNAKLVLVGQGEYKDKLSKKAKSLGLENNVLLVGMQLDMQAWYSTFDFFVFPSIFEGLGLAAVEAQANGLPVIASKKVIPDSVKINPNFVFEALSLASYKWAQIIEEKNNLPKQRLDNKIVKKNFIEHHYEIDEAAKRLEKLF